MTSELSSTNQIMTVPPIISASNDRIIMKKWADYCISQIISDTEIDVF